MLKQVGSEINAKFTCSEGRKEAVNGERIKLTSLESNPLIAPLDDSVTELQTNSRTEETKADSSH
ncbi:hypothetical protein [Priestia megaterium]|uniref:hypothetical protein n=1 Tax=Priestia megaterium TaxID=1404 RepID=UPI00203EEFFE|nr:hypothetical protein [Priestia megaterium]MCM3181905.1 hypothetical protein [Priestia megaterium]